MGRRIVVLFDGTWNNRKDRTNVVRMRESVETSGPGDPVQPCFYDPGVGTNRYERITGGAFGQGLSENIRQGYAWLAEKHVPEDQVFVFGFSRGAYTARSLVGFIRKCGLLNSPRKALVAEAYELYRDKSVAPDDSRAVEFRAQHSREIRVRFIGVWDTVGALGIPVSHVPFSSDYYSWHDTDLSKIVEYAYHAVAADERRRDYAVAVWTKIKGTPGPQDSLAEVDDSFKKFMFGIYRVFKNPYDRPFGSGANETVDATVWQRWRAMTAYRPVSLQKHPDRPPT